MVSWVKKEASRPQRILGCGSLINVLRLNRVLDRELGSERQTPKMSTTGQTP